MFALEKHDVQPAEISEDISRDKIAETFRLAMVSHFRSHVPVVNETTLISSDYLNHLRKLVSLLDSVASEAHDSVDELLCWRPIGYEEHFTNSDLRDKALAVAAYRKAPANVRALFDETVSRFHAEALALITEIAAVVDA